ncbi:hypothetical protein [Pseudoxanthomonas suwonensis]|uniref:Uncharacterized protein n=1 Tax=Pseudoxanthomonas suwonensis TaxID=314722 RepID=A0A0E3UP99_9GAMM|nr:hypothetical protein [Pseudoxanthomonas suwonensis]AKC87625.1 hypothetical protein WQ53_13540 [Pseudoxanthomonas suwonensis]
MVRIALLSTMLLATSAAATSNEIPQVTGVPGSTCGYVSDQRGAVPRSQDIFPVEITRIDGRSTPLDPRNRHLVQPGTRTLTVTDHIDVHRLPGAAVAQIEKMKRLEQQRAYKPFTVEVQPGVSYAIGARLLRDRLDAQSIRDNAYWEPVVWDQRPEACP